MRVKRGGKIGLLLAPLVALSCTPRGEAPKRGAPAVAEPEPAFEDPAPPLRAGRLRRCDADEADIVFSAATPERPWIAMSLPGQSEAGPTALELRISPNAYRELAPAKITLVQSRESPDESRVERRQWGKRAIRPTREGRGWCLEAFDGSKGVGDAYDFFGVVRSGSGRSKQRAAAVLAGEPELANIEPWVHGRLYLQMERHAGTEHPRGEAEILKWLERSPESLKSFKHSVVRVAHVDLITEVCGTEVEVFRRSQDMQPRDGLELVAVVSESDCTGD